MMKIKFYALLFLVAAVMFGCSDEYDDTEVRTQISEITDQVKALQTLIEALQNRDYITSITPTTVDGAAGYVITFAQASPITILNAPSVISAVDTSNDDYVIFTLSDESTITIPRKSGIFVAFDSYDTFYCSSTDNEITLVLPPTLKESDYSSIIATISNGSGTDMDIQTRSASAADKWGVKVSKPTFTDGTLDEGSAKVTLTLPQNRTNYKALLRVSIIDNKGQEFSVNRIVWFKADEDANVIDNTTGDLASKITAPASVKQLSVIGTVSDDDFTFIRENMTSIEVLDLSRATITGLPRRAMAFYDTMGLSDNTSLTTVILPETLTEIGQSAFAMCTALKEMNIPTSMRSIGPWAFEECQSLAQLTLPDELTELSHDAFYSCGIKNINIPSGVTVLNDGLFAYCSNLETVTLHDNITSIGDDVFSICENLLPKNFVLPSKVTSIGARAFTYTGLTSVKIPEGVTSIGHSAFNSCTIKTVDIPSTVTSLASTAFYWKEADVVICRSLTVPTIDEYNPNQVGGSTHYAPFFQIKSTCILKRPAGADYSAWGSYFSSIQNL